MKSSLNTLQRHVLAGGGIWLGVQTGVEETSSLVLFASPTTNITSALPITECTAENVHAKIVSSDKAFGNRYHKIPRKTIDKIVECLRAAITELESFIEEKKNV